MAKLGANFDFTGSLGNISAYKMRGVDGTILRRKGGASRDKVLHSPDMEGTRKGISEFSGRANAGQWVRQLLHRQQPMAGFNITGAINSLMTPIQKLDTEGPFGQRHILISKAPWLLEGFSLNKETGVDTIIRTPLAWSISKETLSARIDVPALLPGINFFVSEKYSMFSLIATLGIVPDFFYSEHGYRPSTRAYGLNQLGIMNTVDTPWTPVLQGAPLLPIELKLGFTPPDQSFSLLLAIGIRYGSMAGANTVQQVKHAGAAKILGMG